MGSGAHKCPRKCLGVLTDHQVKWHAPRQTKRILCGLIKRLNANLGVVSDASCLHSSALSTLRGFDNSLLVNTSNPQQSLAECCPVNFDVIFTDVDVDEILKTFNFAPGEPVLLGTPTTEFNTETSDIISTPPGYIDIYLTFHRTRIHYSFWIPFLDLMGPVIETIWPAHWQQAKWCSGPNSILGIDE